MTMHDLIMPDLEMPDTPARLTLWLVPCGSRVSEGEPIAEILAGPVTVDLSAPADGILRETLVAEDDLVEPGQRLAVVEE